MPNHVNLPLSAAEQNRLADSCVTLCRSVAAVTCKQKLPIAGRILKYFAASIPLRVNYPVQNILVLSV
jgi:hypothetical protein